MTTIIKMLFSILSMVLKLFWKIIKFLSGPMRDSIKDLWKASWELYKARKAQKAASVGNTAESAIRPIDGTGETKERQNTGDTKSSGSNAQS